MNLEFQKEFINFCVNNSEHILKFSIPNKSYEKYSIQTHGMYMCFRDPEDILNGVDLYVNEDFHASNTFRKLLDINAPEIAQIELLIINANVFFKLVFAPSARIICSLSPVALTASPI